MLTLEKGRDYCLKVSKVINGRRSFGNNPTKYVNDITFTDGIDTVTCEYITLDDNQDYFVAGQKGCFEVKFVKNEVKLTYEIERKGSPVDWEDLPLTNFSKRPVYEAPNSHVPAGQPTANISGQSFTFALAYAKDIMIAKVDNIGCPIDDQFREELFALADDMNSWLLKKHKNG